jgi:hypothetical protein
MDVIEVVYIEPAVPAPDYRDDGLDRDDKPVMADSSYALAGPSRRGRPKRVVCKERLTEVLRMYFLEKLSMRRIADIIGVSHMSVYRMLSDPNVELLI